MPEPALEYSEDWVSVYHQDHQVKVIKLALQRSLLETFVVAFYDALAANNKKFNDSEIQYGRAHWEKHSTLTPSKIPIQKAPTFYLIDAYTLDKESIIQLTDAFKLFYRQNSEQIKVVNKQEFEITFQLQKKSSEITERQDRANRLKTIFNQHLVDHYSKLGNKFYFFKKDPQRMHAIRAFYYKVSPLLNNPNELDRDQIILIIRRLITILQAVLDSHISGSFFARLGLTQSRLVHAFDNCITDLKKENIIDDSLLSELQFEIIQEETIPRF